MPSLRTRLDHAQASADDVLAAAWDRFQRDRIDTTDPVAAAEARAHSDLVDEMERAEGSEAADAYWEPLQAAYDEWRAERDLASDPLGEWERWYDEMFEITGEAPAGGLPRCLPHTLPEPPPREPEFEAVVLRDFRAAEPGSERRLVLAHVLSCASIPEAIRRARARHAA